MLPWRPAPWICDRGETGERHWRRRQTSKKKKKKKALNKVNRETNRANKQSGCRNVHVPTRKEHPGGLQLPCRDDLNLIHTSCTKCHMRPQNGSFVNHELNWTALKLTFLLTGNRRGDGATGLLSLAHYGSFFFFKPAKKVPSVIASSC